MPSDDEGSEVESGREQFPKWVQSTLTHRSWCETSKQVSHKLSPLLCSMVNWIKQMVPQPVILPPGAVPIERPKKSSRSSLDKGMHQCILICLSHFENCALHIFAVTNILFVCLFFCLNLTLCAYLGSLYSYVSATGIPQRDLSGYWQQGLRVHFDPPQLL